MSFNSYDLKKRPDQTVYDLNQILARLDQIQSSLRIKSTDGKNVIIIGNQPINPSTGKPYSFGIHTYQVLGDRLEEV